ILDARKKVHACPVCQNLTDSELCPICKNEEMKYIPAGTTITVTVAKADKDYEETDVKVTLGNKMK
ncbi:MAG: hypothetical protein II765_02295, partial [Lachnospiraceae bacterium]|nr:hypothetical protein [Lachnospiraceae bacterium]